MGVKCYLTVVLIYISIMISDVEYFFMHFYDISDRVATFFSFQPLTLGSLCLERPPLCTCTPEALQDLTSTVTGSWILTM